LAGAACFDSHIYTTILPGTETVLKVLQIYFLLCYL